MFKFNGDKIAVTKNKGHFSLITTAFSHETNSALFWITVLKSITAALDMVIQQLRTKGIINIIAVMQ